MFERVVRLFAVGVMFVIALAAEVSVAPVKLNSATRRAEQLFE